MKLEEILNHSLSCPKTLTTSEIKFLKQMTKENPSTFRDIENNFNKIILDGKITIHDIPQIVLLISNLFMDSKYKNLKNINSSNMITFIIDSVFDSGYISIEQNELTILKTIVTTSVKLLDTNIMHSRSWYLSFVCCT